VFGQLKESTIASYESIVAEIESRFGITENKRIYQMQFNNKRQGKGEGLEEYTADIKRLYDWAHPNRDAGTRQEDLVAKFLQGLWDSKARQYVELHRDPSTIEEATQQVAAYMSITHNVNTNDDRHQVRWTKPDNKEGNSVDKQKPTEWKQKGSCFICGMQGHFAKECPERPSSERSNRRGGDHSQRKTAIKQTESGQKPTDQSSQALSATAPVYRPKQDLRWSFQEQKREYPDRRYQESQNARNLSYDGLEQSLN
jgi:hypothetical protein